MAAPTEAMAVCTTVAPVSLIMAAIIAAIATHTKKCCNLSFIADALLA